MNRACARAREMLKPFGKKTNTAKRVLRILTVPLAACALLFGATSASADQTVPFSNHIVKTVNPTGTTVNLFDYWVVNGDNDSSKNINNDNKNDTPASIKAISSSSMAVPDWALINGRAEAISTVLDVFHL